MKTIEEAAGARGPASAGAPVAWALLAALGAARIALLLPFFARYGYFRDELYYIACSKHLAWGYVDQPPFSLAVLAANRALFGDSLLALRWLPMAAGALTVMLAGFIAAKMGAGRFGQALAALALLLSPLLIGSTRFFSMNVFDVLLWMAAAAVFAVILRGGHERLWLLFGAIVGIGLLNKYSMGFFLIGTWTGLLLTRQRTMFLRRSFWAGMVLAGVLFLPHALWELRHGLPSLAFMRNATQLKNVPLSPVGLLLGIFVEGGFVQAILWIAGLAFLLAHPRAAAFRPFGWMFLVVFAIMALSHGKPYYMGPALAVMMAAGGAAIEAITARRARWIRAVLPAAVVLLSVPILPFVIPMLPVESFIRYSRTLGITPQAEERQELAALPQHYADMFGWEEMAQTFASVANNLTPEERNDVLIFVRNYGEAGAIDFFGPRYGLPAASCGHNSYWFWGPPRWDGRVALILGDFHDLQRNLDDLRPDFESVELGGVFRLPYAMPYENGRMIFICRGFKYTMNADLWAHEKEFM